MTSSRKCRGRHPGGRQRVLRRPANPAVHFPRRHMAGAPDRLRAGRVCLGCGPSAFGRSSLGLSWRRDGWGDRRGLPGGPFARRRNRPTRHAEWRRCPDHRLWPDAQRLRRQLAGGARPSLPPPLADPGEADLTAHVDFQALAEAAAPAVAHGPVAQGLWLRRLGIEMRAAALAQANPSKAGEVALACRRLIAPSEMGTLFKVLAIAAPNLPTLPGFADEEGRR